MNHEIVWHLVYHGLASLACLLKWTPYFHQILTLDFVLRTGAVWYGVIN